MEGRLYKLSSLAVMAKEEPALLQAWVRAWGKEGA
jgi:hypothetical protein